MSKKLLFTLVLLMTAATAIAQEEVWANGIYYHYVGNQSVEVARYDYSDYSGEITIPSEIRVERGVIYEGPAYTNLRVVGIAEGAFMNCTDLTKIVIPGTVKTIGKNAFYGCSQLSQVSMDGGVATIGRSAFANCMNLTSITLPNSVTELDWNVFYGCSSLTRVTLSKSIRALNGTFGECTSLASIDIPAGVTTIDGAFKGCTSLFSVNLPRSLSYIGTSAFDGCRALMSIDLPNSVEYVGDRAFANTGLTVIEMPDAVTNLGNNAFYGSTALTSVTSRAVTPPLMDNSDGFAAETYGVANLLVPEVSLAPYQSANWWNLFERITGMSSLNTSYDFEANGIYYMITGASTATVTYKDTGYNSYSGIVSIPASVSFGGMSFTVTEVGNSAFRNCAGLRAVSLPSTVTSIGNYAFYGCSGLRGITFPPSLTTIGERAFYACTGLTDLTIPVAVTTIGNNAFGGIAVQSLTWNARECWSNGGMTASGLRQLNIGDEVTVLPKYLARNSQITSVDLPASLICIDDSAFYSCTGMTSLTIPENVTTIGTNAFYNNRLTSLTWNARECWTTGSTGDDVCYFPITQLTIGDGVEVLPSRFVLRSNITEVNLPLSVKKIGERAFYGCSQLSNFVIHDGVTSVGERAFSFSGIRSLTVGANVTDMGQYALCWMDNLSTLTWNARHCDYAGSMYDNQELSQVTIGDGVEYIPPYFAMSSKITSLVIPNSVKVIGEKAFQDCHSLETLQLSDSLQYIYTSAFEGCSSLLHLFIPKMVEGIGCDCFRGSVSLESIVVDSENTHYDSRDNCNAIFDSYYNTLVLTCKNTKIPDGITRIDAYAFDGQTQMTSFEIPETVTYIGECAFRGCTALTSIEMPDAVEYLGYSAFAGCTGLRSVILSESLGIINSSTFNGCTALTDISLKSVKRINNYAFSNCTALANVSLSSVTHIDAFAFNNCIALKNVYIPASVQYISSSCFAKCSGLESLVVDKDNTVYDSRNNCNGIIKTSNNTLYLGCKATTIPNTVTGIGPSAFSRCAGLTSITIPSSVTTVKSNAFEYCDDLKAITFGSGVTNIESYIIYGSNKMETITCLAQTPPTLAGYGFYNFYNKVTLRVPEASLEAYRSAANWKKFTNIEGIPGAGPGDLNGDGEISISDVTALIDLLLCGGELPPYADVDGDGAVSIKDITVLIDMLLTQP